MYNFFFLALIYKTSDSYSETWKRRPIAFVVVHVWCAKYRDGLHINWYCKRVNENEEKRLPHEAVHLCCHRRDYKVGYNYQISWSKWFKIYTPSRTENVYDFSLIISRSFSVVVFNLFMQRQDFVFSATV